MTQASHSPHLQDSVLHGGPLFRALSKIGMSYQTGRTHFLCVSYAAATWGVMMILTIIQGNFVNNAIKIPFSMDVGEACRFLICGPLLIAAEPIIEPWLRNVLNQLRSLAAEADHSRFDELVASAKRLRDLWWVEALIIMFAIARPHIDPSIALTLDVSSWQQVGGHTSWAETYCNFVAKPLMGCLWLRWLWKYLIWSYLLIKVATLDLRLIPTHPDDRAGLGFVSIGQEKFAVIVCAVAVLVASHDADEIIYGGLSFLSQRWIILTIMILCSLIFVTPLLAFTPKLVECKRRGLFEYGKLAQEYVDAFDSKWIEHRRVPKEEALGHNDISSLADIEAAYNIVQRMHIFLVDRTLLTTFALAIVVPFAPLALTLVSFDQLIDRLLKNFV
jgi:hypothetical protein